MYCHDSDVAVVLLDLPENHGAATATYPHSHSYISQVQPDGHLPLISLKSLFHWSPKTGTEFRKAIISFTAMQGTLKHTSIRTSLSIYPGIHFTHIHLRYLLHSQPRINLYGSQTWETTCGLRQALRVIRPNCQVAGPATWVDAPPILGVHKHTTL